MVFPGKNGCNNVPFGVFPPLAKYSIQAKQGRSHSPAGRDRTSSQLCSASVKLYSVLEMRML